jgi:hypothetical protein
MDDVPLKLGNEKRSGKSFGDWKKSFKSSQVYCQWDPDWDIWGNHIGRKAIQVGVKGQVTKDYVERWIYSINNITNEVIKIRNQKIIDV